MTFFVCGSDRLELLGMITMRKKMAKHPSSSSMITTMTMKRGRESDFEDESEDIFEEDT